MRGYHRFTLQSTARVVLLSIAASALVAGCGGKNAGADQSGDGSRHRGARRDGAASGADINALRALPYVGFSDPRHGEAPKGLVTWDRARALPGYTLLTSRLLCTTELIDMSGAVVNTWKQPGAYWENTKLLPNGDLLVVGADLPEEVDRTQRADRAGTSKRRRFPEGHGYLLRLGWDNSVVWKQGMQVHNDVSIMPDGRILTVTARTREFPELAEAYQAHDDELKVLSGEGEVQSSLSLYDLLAAAPPPYQFLAGSRHFWEGWLGGKPAFRFQVIDVDRAEGSSTPDLLHTNTVAPFPKDGVARTGPLYEPGNVLVTSRHQDLVFIVNLAEKKVLWAWGPGEVMGPHNATWLANGNILLLDNGLGRNWSRLLELDPLTETIAWEYESDPKEDFYTATRGGGERLSNGNTLVTESDMGHLFEITPDGTKVWDYFTPHRNDRGQVATVTLASRFTEGEIAPLLAAHSQGAAPAR